MVVDLKKKKKSFYFQGSGSVADVVISWLAVKWEVWGDVDLVHEHVLNLP